MISRIEGRLIAVEDGRAEIESGDLTYELLIPAADLQDLTRRIDDTIAFYTLHYLEAQGQGSSFTPRLIGFQKRSDRDFFVMFTTVKGVGNRKALRALALPFAAVAEAIAGRDVDVLKSLPEIGKRTAETIVAELHGKVDRFVELKPDGAVTGDVDLSTSLVRDAVAMLVQLGEQAATARHLVERVLHVDPTIDAPEDVIAAAYRLKEAP